MVSRDNRRAARIPVLFHVPIVEWEYMPAATIGDLKPDAGHMRTKSMGIDPLYSGTCFRKELINGLCSLCTKRQWKASHADQAFWKSETDAEIRAGRKGQVKAIYHTADIPDNVLCTESDFRHGLRTHQYRGRLYSGRRDMCLPGSCCHLE